MFNYNRSDKKGLSFQQFLDLVTGKTNYLPKVCGRSYKLRCPAHNDTRPSLSVSEGDDGKILLYCFSGCSARDVCNVLGIKVSDLFTKHKAS